MILDQILEATKRRIDHLADSSQLQTPYQARSLSGAIGAAGVTRNAIIAELKYASPLEGSIPIHRDPLDLARDFIDGGCTALSVLTEPFFFGGSSTMLRQVRAFSQLPILRKDFIIDERQVYETRALGADAILLIATILKERLSHFVDLSLEIGLEPLVEVHSFADVEYALKTRASLIGINNRDLETMEVNLETTRLLSPIISKRKSALVSMSGIRTPADLRYLHGFCDAFLIGSALMKSEKVRNTVEEFVFA